MLEGLKDSLGVAIRKIVKSSGIDDDLIRALAKDVQKALILSDVDIKLILDVTKRLEERALHEKPPPGLSRKDHIVKILYDELSGMLGDESEFEFKSGKQNKIILLGIQGSGKTTTAAKLARLLTRQGYKVGVIGADTYRPGALVQLRTMCQKSNVEVYGEERNSNSPEIVKKGLKHFAGQPLEIILIDTAGRHKEEQDLLDEMVQIRKVSDPDLALLVIDSTIGRRCYSQAEAFHKTIPVGGVVVTKLDSTAKGGGALSASAATGARVMYIGTGEKIDDLQKFSPTRFIGRLLGMGDIKAILDFAKRLESEGDDVRMKRIASGKMNISDFFYQLEEITKAGSLKGMLDSVPGLADITKGDRISQLENNVGKWRYIIQSMTEEEKANPDMIKRSRIKRISRGSGWSEIDVNNLLKQYNLSKNMMKASRGRQMQGTLRRMGLG